MGPHPGTPSLMFNSCFKVLELYISDVLFNCKVLEMELLPMDMGQKQMVTNHINRGIIFPTVCSCFCSAPIKVLEQELEFLKDIQANQMVKLDHMNLHHIQRQATDPRCVCLSQNVSSLEVMESEMVLPPVEMKVNNRQDLYQFMAFFCCFKT